MDPTDCAQIRIRHQLLLLLEEQIGKNIIKSSMEQDRTGEYPTPEVLCITLACAIRTTALALSYSVAEYAAPVWVKLNTELNSAYRAVTGCMKPTNVEDMYLLAGIAPPDIRRDVCGRM